MIDDSTTTVEKADALATVSPAPNALAKRGPRDLLDGLDLTELRDVSVWMSKTKMVPEQFRGKPDDITVCFMFGAELGISPMNSLTSIAVVNGTPSVWGIAVTALVKAAHGYLDMVETNNFADAGSLKEAVATCTMRRRNASGVIETHSKTYSYVMATTAGITGKPAWKGNPGMMLENRARNWCARVAFPEVLKGLPVREEMEDIATLTIANAEAPTVKGSDALGEALAGKTADAKVEVEVGHETAAEKVAEFGSVSWKRTDIETLPGGGHVPAAPARSRLWIDHRDGDVWFCVSVEPAPAVWILGKPGATDYARAALNAEIKAAMSDSKVSNKQATAWANEASEADTSEKVTALSRAPLGILVRLYWALTEGAFDQ